jgi:hypothetical protein
MAFLQLKTTEVEQGFYSNNPSKAEQLRKLIKQLLNIT